MRKWYISSAMHTSGNGKKNLKVDVSDPSQVSGNITIIFRRIKIDPQILFSILLINLIVITRIKSLGSHLRWLQPQSTNVNKLHFRFYYSFEMKIHCYLERQGYLQFQSWLAVQIVNCYWAEQQSLSHLLPLWHPWVSGRLELLTDTKNFFVFIFLQL